MGAPKVAKGGVTGRTTRFPRAGGRPLLWWVPPGPGQRLGGFIFWAQVGRERAGFAARGMGCYEVCLHPLRLMSLTLLESVVQS